VRTLIINAVVVDGTGATARPESTVVVEDHEITEIIERRAPYYDRAGTIIDARGGFVLPGVVNHHVHGLTRGPLMIVGEPALDDARVQTNLDRLLAQGVTTALNVDGYPTTEEALASSRFHPLMVKVSTLHTPAHMAWAQDGPFPFGGIQERHRWTLEEMLERGAPAIGEAGPGVDAHWADYTLIPDAIERRGGRTTIESARAQRLAAEAGDRPEIERLLAKTGVAGVTADDFLAIHEATIEWRRQARTALDEAIAAARVHDVPLILHHTPGTHDAVLEAAEDLGGRVIAGHSNFQIYDPEDACRRARAIRERGGLIDIMSGDAFSARQFQSGPEVTFTMLEQGVVDLISTDYAGGFWDAMLLIAEKAHEAGVIALEEAVRLMTSAPVDAIPKLAPGRGRLIPGAVADIVITEPGKVSAVRDILVSGRQVPVPESW
jgi:alpha-D-ribose 1-methylphosphonate 5-triphosphate diphosphatase PhnM